jgi:hypothetical protein
MTLPKSHSRGSFELLESGRRLFFPPKSAAATSNTRLIWEVLSRSSCNFVSHSSRLRGPQTFAGQGKYALLRCSGKLNEAPHRRTRRCCDQVSNPIRCCRSITAKRAKSC